MQGCCQSLQLCIVHERGRLQEALEETWQLCAEARGTEDALHDTVLGQEHDICNLLCPLILIRHVGQSQHGRRGSTRRSCP